MTIFTPKPLRLMPYKDFQGKGSGYLISVIIVMLSNFCLQNSVAKVQAKHTEPKFNGGPQILGYVHYACTWVDK
jgi:hypothetical protein